MKQNKKNIGNNFFTRHVKWFALATSVMIILLLVGLALEMRTQKTARANNKLSLSEIAGEIKNSKISVPDSSKTFFPNLSRNNGVYVLSKDAAPCEDYKNTTKSKTFAFRCKTLRSIYRGYWTKKIDVSGYSRLRVNAQLGVKNYTNTYFAECGYRGVNSDNSVELMLLSTDPNIELENECNHEVGEDKWSSHCFISNEDTDIITHCGIPQCSASKSCDMQIDISGQKEIYMLFSVVDDWFADVEGSLSNVEVTLTK